MADKGMPPFLKKKLGKGSETESESESASESASDDAASSDSPAAKGMGSMSPSNPLAKWAQKKKG